MAGVPGPWASMKVRPRMRGRLTLAVLLPLPGRGQCASVLFPFAGSASSALLPRAASTARQLAAAWFSGLGTKSSPGSGLWVGVRPRLQGGAHAKGTRKGPPHALTLALTQISHPLRPHVEIISPANALFGTRASLLHSVSHSGSQGL